MRKKGPPKRRNALAAALRSPSGLYRKRVVQDRTKYTRNPKHKGEHRDAKDS